VKFGFVAGFGPIVRVVEASRTLLVGISYTPWMHGHGAGGGEAA
jgi:hypothetical protein